MARRQQLSETQLAELFGPPIEQRELVRHYTLPSQDMAAAQRCRGDHNRLGYALMLCYLRHPGRALRAGERPPAAMVAFVAIQIGVAPGAMDEYVEAERSRQRHAIDCQEHLGLRPFGRRARAELLDALLYQQSETPTGRHHTDGGGDSDHVFALCSLLGFQFAPRIPDLKHRRLYSFAKPSEYPTLEPMPSMSTLTPR